MNEETKCRLDGSRTVALQYKGTIYAVIKNPQFYPFRKELFCAYTFGTTNPSHPAVEQIINSGDFLVGGDVVGFQKIVWGDGFDKYRLTPKQLREMFRKYGVRKELSFLTIHTCLFAQNLSERYLNKIVIGSFCCRLMQYMRSN